MIRIFLFLFLLNFSCSVKIPPYFSQCSKSDPKVNDCIAHNANGGLYAFVKGDKSYNIQIISELDGAKIKNAIADLDDKKMELAMYMPRATLLGQYNLKGKISILPIDERGPVNITVMHSRIKYNFTYELLERKGLHYMNITSSAMSYKSERAFFKFYNLFAGHEFLGDVINESLNENWFATNQEMAPAISNSLCKITTSSLKGFFEKVPYEELLGE